MRHLVLPSLLLLSFAGCATDSSSDAEDGANDDLPADGKADSGGLSDGTPEACGVLHLANTASVTALKSHGVATTAAKNIVAYRNGDDETAATDDDESYDTIHELDAIPYVGPVAFAKLLAYAESRGDVEDCEGGVTSPPTPLPTGACVGATVPGDYASLQDALDAIAHAGQDATICLGAGSFTATGSSSSQPTFKAQDLPAHRKALRIVGAGRDQTHILSEIDVSGGWASVTVQSLSVEPTAAGAWGMFFSGNSALHVELIDSRFGKTVQMDSSFQAPFDVIVDRVEFVAGLWLHSYSAPMTAKVSNSYFHRTLDAYSGSTALTTDKVDLTLVNNTFVGGNLSLSKQVIATVANNIFTGATTAAMSWDNLVTFTGRNNALWGNAANYGNLATEGTNYVKADCLIETTNGIPTLRAGSPCIDKADTSLAPARDYLNNARGTHADIGAVER